MSKQSCDKLISQIEAEVRSEFGNDEAIVRFENEETRNKAASEWLVKFRERPELMKKISQISVTPGGQLSVVREVLHAAVDGAKGRIAAKAAQTHFAAKAKKASRSTKVAA